jgi:hypothetical protein
MEIWKENSAAIGITPSIPATFQDLIFSRDTTSWASTVTLVELSGNLVWSINLMAATTASRVTSLG